MPDQPKRDWVVIVSYAVVVLVVAAALLYIGILIGAGAAMEAEPR